VTTLTTQPNLDRTLMALADPTRRAILERLSKGEARVTELAQPFTMSLNAVSKHIRILERARLVRRRCVGRDHFLSLSREPLDEAAAWIEAQRAVWAARLNQLAAILQAEKGQAEKGQAEKGQAEKGQAEKARAEDRRRKTPAGKSSKKKGRSR
jgi:DNA-binding transcriptional ArsR family regulator